MAPFARPAATLTMFLVLVVALLPITIAMARHSCDDPEATVHESPPAEGSG